MRLRPTIAERPQMAVAKRAVHTKAFQYTHFDQLTHGHYNNIFRAVFALGLFVLKAAAFDQDQKQLLQLLTRLIGAAFFSILSIVPLRQPRPQRRKGGHDPPSNMLDSQSTVGRQLILSRKSRMLALYLILWWYACRAIPSIQSKVAASPVFMKL